MTLWRSNHACDHFHLRAPAKALALAIPGAHVRVESGGTYVLHLDRDDSTDLVHVNGRAAFVVPFPYGTIGLVALMLDDNDYGDHGGDSVDIFIARSAFDRMADAHGADRITNLELFVGGAAGDGTLNGLARCLAGAVTPPAKNDRFMTEIAAAMHVHLAQQFGGMRAPPRPTRGGLTAWQLRLVRTAMNKNLDREPPMADLARQCGLSVSHFARGFACSTGFPPHRWLVQRRVAAAKDLLKTSNMSLAEVALHCGFSDQSHFTRVFARSVKMTPGKWRDRNGAKRPIASEPNSWWSNPLPDHDRNVPSDWPDMQAC